MNTTEIRPAKSFPFSRKEHTACAFNISCLRASLRSSVMPSIRCITASIFSLYASVNITRTASRSNHRQLLCLQQQILLQILKFLIFHYCTNQLYHV
ncbi:hypothetical protein GGADHKLB_00886 [[Clostridium] scindens]|uniref:Uncharacterized protein n=1 Tax=Clostridium scindens (strain ATCC 35704 / DSM 5676 / VPI 13733 / 19) TaxID=411468 RepID=A0A494WJR3_CLOS5|nr:hypothetical protein HDCHBGLK_01741 [[Clostridium] scindens ATCC 35704]WBX64874.1 hypothetical protein GGADHKLB_00886 [[Clostridium] scindens]BCZ29422.1 hypothetical protein CSCING10_006160 [[Clostridium] scindens]